jgi:phenylalanyl-tRNA synthetase beta chain
MKVSVNQIKYYQELYEWSENPAPEGVTVLVERIGAQLAGVEETTAIGKKYAGIIIVKVVECHKHENSDHLNVCLIDDGGVMTDVTRDANGHIQVVCGAPNVRAGLTVAWLPPGATVPSSYDSDPFVLSVREIRGVVSNGMLASPKELALGDSHEGILEIDEDVAPGTMFADKYNLTDDIIIDMENKMFTHRPDCFGMLGIAREIAGIQGQRFTSPEWYRADAQIAAPEQPLLRVEVRNELPELVPRFAAVPMAGVKIMPSPVWLQVELSRLGVRPINNIVDLTNYYMLLTGQPLHAYDYDKVVAQDSSDDGSADHATLVVRHPYDGEQLTLLNGKEIEPRSEAIMIATPMKPIGLGGVMGGGDTEIDDTTTNIILESACFDMYSIRRTSMAHGIFTDAVTRFNKGQSPLQNMAVLAKIVSDIERIAGGRIAGDAVDDNHLSQEIQNAGSLHDPVAVSAGFINQRLGLSLAADEIVTLLQNVEFRVEHNEGTDQLRITAPFWRTDIEIAEDIVEEVGRLYGFDRLPLALPMRDLAPAAKDPMLDMKLRVRNALSQAGANEVLTYSFVHGNLLDRVGQNKTLAYRLSNALSPELQYFRMSLTPSLLDKVHANIKAGYDEFALFEMGKSHFLPHQDDPTATSAQEVPSEMDWLAVVFAANTKAAANHAGAAYYQAQKYLLTLLDDLGIADQVKMIPYDPDTYVGSTKLKTAQYEVGRTASIIVPGYCLGEIGEYRSTVRKSLKLPDYCAGFELDLSLLLQLSQQAALRYQKLSRFPKVRQDITLRIAADLPYQTLHDFVQGNLRGQLPDGDLLTMSALDIYQRTDDAAYKQVTFRLEFTSYDKTMTDTEVGAMLDTLAVSARDTLNAERI